MSLINKMLQDLDARGGGADSALQQQELKAVPLAERDRKPLMLAGGGAALVVLAVGGWFGWQYWVSHRIPVGPVPKVVDNSVPPGARIERTPVQPQPQPAAPSTMQPDAVRPAAADSTPAAVAPRTELAGDAPAPAAPAKRNAAAEAEVAAEQAMPAMVKERKAARQAAAKSAAAPANEGTITHDISPQQMAENTYRRALVALQEGRVNAALADLERALDIDPRNEAARQTYISLLLENRRSDDAVRQLRLALGIDPRQPGLAMVLARLQLEKGGPALDTLMKTLPYAGGSAEYQAFLAGVLQREQRHTEAADHYREALKLSPQNGVWWMGLGISLQADQHLPEAREAFKRARATAGLTPELQAFIDRKLEQLSR
ncbi:tetratricopeptide repeat protein [Duganella sp. LjRoot269]|jgi:MSHA biogenesis protein MshN|uniref:tetratricopeptide repeat protein n=1 Tax=Duganella sp. LjRoot269 TaxID=3342305 RepID=UPI003ED04501